MTKFSKPRFCELTLLNLINFEKVASIHAFLPFKLFRLSFKMSSFFSQKGSHFI